MQYKNRIIRILHYLEDKTDEAHPATVAEILTYLEKEGIPSNRKAVSADIEQLIDSGVDIVKNTGRRNEYFIGDRLFEQPELQLLIDAVKSARFISPRKSEVLIAKLCSLASVHQAASFKENIHLDDCSKSTNEKLYITADILRTAIAAGRQVSFKYYEYTQNKRKIYKHSGYAYHISPYALIWNDANYYVAAFSEKHDKIVAFRVDRMAVPKLLSAEAAPPPADFDVNSYMGSVFTMFDGAVREVTLKCENTIMKSIIDRFGEDVKTKPLGKEHFSANVSVATSRTFYGWVFSFAGAMQITAPTDVADEFAAMLSCMAINRIK